MELKDFVQKTIVEIVEGVKAAQIAAKGSNANINPTRLQYHERGEQHIYAHGRVEQIAFDVTLTKTDHKGAEGIGVVFGSTSLSALETDPDLKEQRNRQETSLTRVQFSIPIMFPPGQDVIPK